MYRTDFKILLALGCSAIALVSSIAALLSELLSGLAGCYPVAGECFRRLELLAGSTGWRD